MYFILLYHIILYHTISYYIILYIYISEWKYQNVPNDNMSKNIRRNWPTDWIILLRWPPPPAPILSRQHTKTCKSVKENLGFVMKTSQTLGMRKSWRPYFLWKAQNWKNNISQSTSNSHHPSNFRRRRRLLLGFALGPRFGHGSVPGVQVAVLIGTFWTRTRDSHSFQAWGLSAILLPSSIS